VARVLLVDDEPEIRLLTTIIVKRAGHEVIEAHDGEEAMKILEKERPDIILLDVMMPGASGWDICENIKANEELKDIPVVMFTIMSGEKNIEKSFKSGADAQVNKPFDIDNLLDTMERLLRKS